MSNSNKTVILDAGLNQVNNWGVAGTYFSVKYFLPVYDPSIDNNIHSSTQVLTDGLGTNVRPLSASILSTQTSETLIGDKLWNADNSYVQSSYGVVESSAVYSTSDSDKFVITSASNLQHGYGYSISPTVSSGNYISGSSQDTGGVVNVIGGQYTLSQAYSASDLSAVSTGSEGTYFAGNISATSLAPELTLSGGSMLYSVRTFVPVNVSASDPSVDAGRYIVQLDSSVGNFKFNKIIFYLAKMNTNGTEDTSFIPTPFAQMVWEGTSNKQISNSNNAGVVWEGIIDLIFQRDTGTNNLTYLNTDNWNYMNSTFGLSTVNDVKIYSSGVPANIINDAKLEIYDNTRKQLKLAYDLSAYSYLWTDSANTFNVSAESISISGATDFNNPVTINDSIVMATGTSIIAEDPYQPIQMVTDIEDSLTSATFGENNGSGHFQMSVNAGAGTFSFASDVYFAGTFFNSSATFYNDVTFNDPAIFNDSIAFGIDNTQAIGYEMIPQFTSGANFMLSALTNIPLTDDIYDIRLVYDADLTTYTYDVTYILGTTSAEGVQSTEIPGVHCWARESGASSTYWTIIIQPSDPQDVSTIGRTADRFRALVWYKNN